MLGIHQHEVEQARSKAQGQDRGYARIDEENLPIKPERLDRKDTREDNWREKDKYERQQSPDEKNRPVFSDRRFGPPPSGGGPMHRQFTRCHAVSLRPPRKRTNPTKKAR